MVRYIGFDLGMSMIKNVKNNEFKPELVEKMKSIKGQFSSEFEGLMKWIQQPIYSPDYALGKDQKSTFFKE